MMRNVMTKLKDDGKTLLIKIDLTQDFGPTSTGKTNTVASTGGFVPIEDGSDIILSVNVNKRQSFRNKRMSEE